MKDEDKTREQLINELIDLRQRVVQLEKENTGIRQAKEELLFKTALLEAQSETSLDGILAVDGKGRSILYNRRFHEMWSIPQELSDTNDDNKMLQYAISQLKDPDGFLEKVEYLYAHKEDKSRDEIAFKDGKVFDRYSSPLVNSRDEYCGRIWYFRDITDRKQAEKAFRESEEKLQAIINNSTAVIFVKDLEGKYLLINSLYEKLFHISKEQIVEKTDYDLFSKESADAFREADLSVLKGRKAIEVEETVPQDDGTHYYISLKFPLYDRNGEPYAVCAIATDITERKRAEDALSESEEKFRILAEKSPNMIFINQKGRVVYANEQCEAIMGYKREEFYSPTFDFFTLIAPESIDLVRANFLHHMKGEEIDPYEYTVITKDGKRIEAIITKKLIRYNGENAILGIVTDISERKKAEEELKNSHERLRELNRRLQSIREQERKKIAREIHDELGQMLTALKMDFSWFSKKLPKDQNLLLEKIHSIDELIDMSIQSVQSISSELRPGLLDDLGITSAIEWQANEFQNRAGIQCKLTLDPEDIILERDLSTAIFRIFQETLTNVARHANATKAKVDFKEKDGTVTLRVMDNGRGITEQQISDPKSLGLIGMRERALQWGGSITIKGYQSKGTTVTVRIPLDKK